MSAQMVFQRREIKYLMSCRQQELILKRMEPYMEPDAFSHSSVRNIYYDTPDFRLIRTSMEKPVYKEKLRLRGYGRRGAGDEVFLELKKKYRDVVYKRRIALPQNQAAKIMSRQLALQRSQIGREIGYALDYYGKLEPAVFLGYDREAYCDRMDGNFRVTFDRNICYRQQDLTLDSDLYGMYLLEKDQVLMELKAVGALPLWMVRALTEAGVPKISFSKYGSAYQTILQRERTSQYA